NRKSLGLGFILAEGFSTQELWGALDRFLPELVVHAGAPDVILDLDVARKDVRRAERRAGEGPESAEVGVEELALDRPAVPQRVFNAATDGPTAARAALWVAGRNGVGGLPFGGVDFFPGVAAPHLHP